MVYNMTTFLGFLSVAFGAFGIFVSIKELKNGDDLIAPLMLMQASFASVLVIFGIVMAL